MDKKWVAATIEKLAGWGKGKQEHRGWRLQKKIVCQRIFH